MSSWLHDSLRSFGAADALVWQDQAFSYHWLADATDRWLQDLQRNEVRRGQVVGVAGDFSPNCVALLIALIMNGDIAVPLSSMTASQRDTFLKISEAQHLVLFDANDTYSHRKLGHDPENALLRQLAIREEAGLVLFSSGSTGTHKAVLHSFPRLLKRFSEPGRPARMLVFLLLDHIGGINTLFHSVSSGGTLVTPRERSVRGVCAAIQQHRVETLPTSPTFLNLLLMSEEQRRFDLSSLRLITFGTEPMPATTLSALGREFPQVTFKQTYGLSEVGILSTKSKSDGSLWMKVGGLGFETRVVNGTLWIRADSAMLGYLNAPSPLQDDGWFDTGDVVETEGEYVRIVGRVSEVINVGGQKVYPAEVENVLLGLDNVRNATVHGEANSIIGQVVVARLTLDRPEDLLDLKRRIRTQCRGRLEPYKIPAKVEVTVDQQVTSRFKRARKTPEVSVP